MHKPGKVVQTCRVVGCSNTSESDPNMLFFPIPLDRRTDKWLHRIDPCGSNKKTNKICADHFEDDDILLFKNTKILKQTALPSKNLPIKIINECVNEVSPISILKVAVSKCSQTEDINDNETQQDVNITRDKPATFYKLCDLFFTEELAKLLCAHQYIKYKIIQLKSKNEDFMRFYFNLYQKSPLTYQFAKSMYNLPNDDDLLKKYIKADTKISDETLSTLQARVDKMTPRERNCSMLIKSVELKANLCYNIKEGRIYGLEEIDGVQYSKLATTAIVIMVKGIFGIWKQPVGYILVSQDCNEGVIRNWIDMILTNLFKIGLNVRTCVLGMKENLLYKKTVCSDVPFFLHEDKIIYLIFDSSEVINSIRDTMQTHEFHFQKKVARYNDIVNFYAVDTKRPKPYAYKLTKNHINPNKKQKQDVKYAAQLMSKTVANGIGSYIHLGLINAEYGTAEFLARINDLFDALNTNRRKRDDDQNERKKPICKNKTQKEFLKEVIVLFERMRVINPKNGQDVTTETKFIDGVIISIQSILALFEDLNEEGHNVMWTENLQRNALNDFITKLHSNKKQGTSSKLTTTQFFTAFRKNFYLSIKRFIKGDCKKDVTNFVAQIQKLCEEIRNDDNTMTLDQIIARTIPKEENSQTDTGICTKSVRMINNEDYSKIDMKECQSLSYICNYIMSMVQRNHARCEILHKYLLGNKLALETGENKLELCNINKSLQIVPCNHFITYIQQMDKKFVYAFTKCSNWQPHIGNTLYEEVGIVNYDKSPCPCFPKEFVKSLFIRIRLYCTIHINNTEYRKNKLSHNSFLVKHLE